VARGGAPPRANGACASACERWRARDQLWLSGGLARGESSNLLGKAGTCVVTTAAPASAGASLREAEALSRLACFRCLTSPQLDEFLHDPARGTAHAREMATHRLLRRLRRGGHVVASRRLVGGPGGGTARVVYQLSESGHRLARSTGGSAPGERPWARTAAFVEHRLMTADVALAFLRAARAQQGHDLVAWESDREAAELLRFAVMPDARLVYAATTWELSAFVEVDLGSERPIRFADKIRRYLAAWRDGVWREQLVIWPLVLTVAADGARATALRRAAEDVLEREDGVDAADAAAFFFSAIADVDAPAGPLGEIWQVAGRSGRRSIVDRAPQGALPDGAEA